MQPPDQDESALPVGWFRWGVPGGQMVEERNRVSKAVFDYVSRNHPEISVRVNAGYRVLLITVWPTKMVTPAIVEELRRLIVSEKSAESEIEFFLEEENPNPSPYALVGGLAHHFDAENMYQIDTISLASGPKARWIIFKGFKYEAGPCGAAGVLRHYCRQPTNKKAQGIFIHSKTFLISLTPEEETWATPHVLGLHKDPRWKKSENSLVAELVAVCDKKGIKVWVNTSYDLSGEWKLLTNANWIPGSYCLGGKEL